MEIRPSKKYLVIGIGALWFLLFFVFWTFYIKESAMLIICSMILFPMLSCFAACFLLPYYNKRIKIENQRIILTSAFGREKIIEISQITKVRMNILLDQLEAFEKKKKLFYASSAYNNYFELVYYLKENCNCEFTVQKKL